MRRSEFLAQAAAGSRSLAFGTCRSWQSLRGLFRGPRPRAPKGSVSWLKLSQASSGIPSRTAEGLCAFGAAVRFSSRIAEELNLLAALRSAWRAWALGPIGRSPEAARVERGDRVSGFFASCGGPPFSWPAGLRFLAQRFTNKFWDSRSHCRGVEVAGHCVFVARSIFFMRCSFYDVTFARIESVARDPGQRFWRWRTDGHPQFSAHAWVAYPGS